MVSILHRHWVFILLLCVISVFYLFGTPTVPFHPDESTFLFMSAEFERTTSNPLDLAWDSADSLTPTLRYRMIDAPLTRYIIGAGRSIANIPALDADWNWSGSWGKNQAAGAFPDAALLNLGRLTIASLFPLSLILLYLISLKLDGRLLGVVAVLIFSLNPLILLHTRRAMAEGALIFAVLLALYALLYADKYPFLGGLAVGLAFTAKHSAGLLLPIGLIAVCWTSYTVPRKYTHIFSNFVRFLVGFGLLTLLLNPFLWRSPLPAAQTALSLRQDLIERQVADYETIAPSQVLGSTRQRTAVAIAQVFIAPPIFSEAGNYAAFTAAAEKLYLNSTGNQIGHQPLIAGILIGLSLLGLVVTTRTVLGDDLAARRNAAILLLAFMGFNIGIILLIPLAWQRYYLPLIPFTAIFAGLGFVWGIKTSRGLFAHGRLSARLSQILTQFAPDSWMS